MAFKFCIRSFFDDSYSQILKYLIFYMKFSRIKNHLGEILMNFNKTEFENILELIKSKKYIKSLLYFQDYFEKYPNDICAHLYYASTLLKLGNTSEALKILESDLFLELKREEDRQRFFNLKLKLYLDKKEYFRCYQYILSNEELFGNNKNADNILAFLYKKLNIKVEKKSSDSYTKRQIIEYSKDDFYSYETKYFHEHKNSYFTEGFDLSRVYNIVSSMIPNSTGIKNSYVIDFYLFKFNRVGYVNGKLVDYIAVHCIKDTNEILKILPYDNIENCLYTDLRDQFEDNHSKVKMISQIDKFYQRFKKQ